jgi:predicted nucleotidyltransferase
MDSDAFIELFTETVKTTFGNNLQSIVLFGSYARGEEKPGSDFDVYCLFKTINEQLLKKMGHLARSFFSAHEKPISYPICITVNDYYHRGFDDTFGDPIKYFEGRVLYGESFVPKPSRERVAQMAEDILRGAVINLRYHISAGTSVSELANGALRSEVLKPLIVALRLEQYLSKKKYPLHTNELLMAVYELPEKQAVEWFITDGEFRKQIFDDAKTVLHQLSQMIDNVFERVSTA